MELMKRIVAGLVESVQSLSKAKEVQEIEGASNESFPFPVQVTAPKAHLRKGADLSAPSLLNITGNIPGTGLLFKQLFRGKFRLIR